MINYLPSPLDVPDVEGLEIRGKQVTDKPTTRPASDEAPLSALVFKIVSDTYGLLSFVRIYSGKLEAGKAFFNANKGKRERINKLLRMHANQREEISVAYAGDIVAVVGFKEAVTGDTLCDDKQRLLLENH